MERAGSLLSLGWRNVKEGMTGRGNPAKHNKLIVKNFGEFDGSIVVQLVFTRQGIKVTGCHYYRGIQGGFIPWSEVDKIRRQLNQKESGEREDNDV